MSLLNKSTKGKNIVGQFKLTNSFTNDMRAKLVDIIVDEVIRKDMSRGNSTASQIARNICEIFPTECEVR